MRLFTLIGILFFFSLPCQADWKRESAKIAKDFSVQFTMPGEEKTLYALLKETKGTETTYGLEMTVGQQTVSKVINAKLFHLLEENLRVVVSKERKKKNVPCDHAAKTLTKINGQESDTLDFCLDHLTDSQNESLNAWITHCKEIAKVN